MPRGRKRGPPTRELRFCVPEELFVRIHLVLLDPMTQKMEFGKLSQVGTKLFNDWLKQIGRSDERNS